MIRHYLQQSTALPCSKYFALDCDFGCRHTHGTPASCGIASTRVAVDNLSIFNACSAPSVDPVNYSRVPEPVSKLNSVELGDSIFATRVEQRC